MRINPGWCGGVQKRAIRVHAVGQGRPGQRDQHHGCKHRCAVRMIAVKLDLFSSHSRALIHDALETITKAGGAALFIPGDFGWRFGDDVVTGVVSNGATLSGVDVVESTALGYHGLSFTNTTTLQAQFRFRAKVGSKSWVWARFAGYEGGNAWFNLATGEVGIVESGVVASIAPLGDGYHDCLMTNRNATPAGSCTLHAVTANGSTNTYQGNGSVAFQLQSYGVHEITSAVAYVDGVKAVTAVGDTLGVLKDQANSNHALQVSEGSRPIVSLTPIGTHAFTFDAIDDRLIVSLASGGAPWVKTYTTAGTVEGYTTASASQFVLGQPMMAGKSVVMIVATSAPIVGADAVDIDRLAVSKGAVL